MPLLTPNLQGNLENVDRGQHRRMKPVMQQDGGPNSLGVGSHLVSTLFGVCAYPGCRSGWLHLWRGRTRPVLEEGWTCSPECTAALVTLAINREWAGPTTTQEKHPHRIPLGLIMLERGWITQSQLRSALEAQKEYGSGRLGEWLVRRGVTTEERVTRALALQWKCPVLAADRGCPASLTWIAPRLFLDAYRVVPLRVVARQLLYLAFEEALDPVVAFAIARMTGLQVESGVVQGTIFEREHKGMLEAPFPAIELVEAVSVRAAALALARALERNKPVASKLARIHDCLWLRMWRRLPTEPFTDVDSVHDLVCSIGEF